MENSWLTGVRGEAEGTDKLITDQRRLLWEGGWSWSVLISRRLGAYNSVENGGRAWAWDKEEALYELFEGLWGAPEGEVVEERGAGLELGDSRWGNC